MKHKIFEVRDKLKEVNDLVKELTEKSDWYSVLAAYWAVVRPKIIFPVLYFDYEDMFSYDGKLVTLYYYYYNEKYNIGVPLAIFEDFDQWKKDFEESQKLAQKEKEDQKRAGEQKKTEEERELYKKLKLKYEAKAI